MDTPHFHCFNKLPPELRALVWASTMPDEDRQPALYPFGKSFINWLAWREPSPDLDSESAKDSSLEPKELLIRLPTPPALFVCREARRVAENWIASMDAWLHWREEAKGHTVVRNWQDSTDILYVSLEMWEDFLIILEDYRDGARTPMFAKVKHLALPAFKAYYSLENLLYASQYLPGLCTLYMVWGQPPECCVVGFSNPDSDDAVLPVQRGLVAEDSSVVTMYAVQEDTVLKEECELEEIKDDIEEMLQIAEIPEQHVTEDGEITIEVVHVKLAEERDK